MSEWNTDYTSPVVENDDVAPVEEDVEGIVEAEEDVVEDKPRKRTNRKKSNLAAPRNNQLVYSRADVAYILAFAQAYESQSEKVKSTLGSLLKLEGDFSLETVYNTLHVTAGVSTGVANLAEYSLATDFASKMAFFTFLENMDAEVIRSLTRVVNHLASDDSPELSYRKGDGMAYCQALDSVVTKMREDNKSVLMELSDLLTIWPLKTATI